MAFKDLRSFLLFLESRGRLKRIKAEVDPRLEVTEIALRVVREQGPALLFENVKGSSVPLLVNALGTAERIEWALGGPPADIGNRLHDFAQDMMPPQPAKIFKHMGLVGRALKMRPSKGSPAWQGEAPDLDLLPILQCWPEDGGRFITWPLVITQNPLNGRRNVGLYRMHVYDKSHTGMHWQIQKGGGFHYAEAEKKNEPLPLAVVLGADPVTMMAGMWPLPEDMDELAFAAFVRNAPARLAKLDNGLSVPADAEIVLEGWVKPGERRTEGPFGDHFGHYSHAAPFPVFEITRVHRRPGAIYPAAVVGKPPQEDKYLGNAAQEMFLPLLKVMKPELADLWTYFEAGFHNLAVAAVKQRYQKEALKTAFGLLGEGQLSLTKCLVLVDPGVDVRNFGSVLEALRKNFDPSEDFILLPGTSQDTLDFTSFKMNLGSKMILDATSFGKDRSGSSRGAAPTRHFQLARSEGQGGGEILASRNWNDSLLAVQVKGGGRAIVERLVKDPALAGYKIIAAVSEDVPLADDELLIWGLFTRFDCARDLVPAGVEMRGGAPRYAGPLGLDATWKTGYPKALEMDPAVVTRVSKRWSEYGL